MLFFQSQLLEYVLVARNVPTIAQEVSERILKLIRSFNSQVCELILGSGAHTSGQLTNITAKHLALSWNCI